MEGDARSRHTENPQSSVPADQVTALHTSRLIVHCPEDVLKLIFEAIPPHHNTRWNFRQASRLAAVCHTWRVVALDNPRIWSDIELRMGPSDRGWEEYWAHTVERVKKVPVKIRIHKLCLEHPNKLSRVIQEASLTIDLLRLEFEHPADINSLARIWGEFRVHVMDLCISTDSFPRSSEDCIDKRTGGWYKGLDFGALLKSVHCHRSFSFEVSGMYDIIRFPRTPNTSIVQLYLQRLFGVDITEVCRIFPALESLCANRCRFEPVLPKTSIPQLRSLQFESCNEIGWLVNIDFLRLECLSYDWCFFPQLDQFIARHQTITTLSIGNTIGGCGMEDIQNMAYSANRVLFLTLHSRWAGCLSAEHAFPSLHSFTILNAFSVDIMAFDLLVKERCLPPSHPKSEAKGLSRILNEFFIEGDENMLYRSYLIKSHWYIEAAKELQRRPESDVVKVKLAWPIHSGSSS